MSDKLVVRGVKELVASFKALPHDIQKQAMEPAVKEAAEIIRVQAKENAPLGDTGNLKKSLTKKKQKTDTTFTTHYSIFGRSKIAYYWWMVENGTVKRPDARPYLRPAFEAKAGEANQHIIKALNRRLKKWNSKS